MHEVQRRLILQTRSIAVYPLWCNKRKLIAAATPAARIDTAFLFREKGSHAGDYTAYSNKHFQRRRMSEKCLWTRACPIGAGLENHDQIARFGARQDHAFG